MILWKSWETCSIKCLFVELKVLKYCWVNGKIKFNIHRGREKILLNYSSYRFYLDNGPVRGHKMQTSVQTNSKNQETPCNDKKKIEIKLFANSMLE